jgi:hypothetical protein
MGAKTFMIMTLSIMTFSVIINSRRLSIMTLIIMEQCSHAERHLCCVANKPFVLRVVRLIVMAP